MLAFAELMSTILFVLDTALLQWISEYAVRAYTTADSAVSYLNHARMAQTTPSCVVCSMTHDCRRKLRKHSTSASWVWF